MASSDLHLADVIAKWRADKDAKSSEAAAAGKPASPQCAMNVSPFDPEESDLHTESDERTRSRRRRGDGDDEHDARYHAGDAAGGQDHAGKPCGNDDAKRDHDDDLYCHDQAAKEDMEDKLQQQLPIKGKGKSKGGKVGTDDKDGNGMDLLGPAPPTPFVFVKPGGEALSPMSNPLP